MRDGRHASGSPDRPSAPSPARALSPWPTCAAMAPGVNAYVFASMYDRAVGAVATTVIISTLACVATASFWLWMLGGGNL